MDGYAGQLAADGAPVNLIRLSSPRGIEAVFMDWGATWLSCRVPVTGTDPTSEPAVGADRREVLLRSPNLSEHLKQSAYFGATVGRYANRIANGMFAAPNGQPGSGSQRRVRLHTNEAGNTLHGGPEGFHRRRWKIAEQSDTAVTFELLSAAGDQGFPGNLEVQVSYQLTSENTLLARFKATTDDLTPVNLTNHAYFNLAARQQQILDHELQIHADWYLPVNAAGIPTEGPKSVTGTGFDFRTPKTIGRDLLRDEDQAIVHGYDHSFLLQEESATLTSPAASAISPDKRLRLDILTDKPALQFYSGNFLAGTPGADGRNYRVHSGFALETQFLPDAPNHPEWPHASCMLQPDEIYRYQTLFRFTNPSQFRA